MSSNQSSHQCNNHDNSDNSREPPPSLPTPTGELPMDNNITSKAGFKQELEAVEAGLLQLEQGIEDKTRSEESLADLQLIAARKLRQLLSTNRELLIQEVLERNWIPLLLGWLQLHQRPSVQVEALWALTNIAAGTGNGEPNTSRGSGEQHVLMKHGAIPILIGLLSSPNDEVLEQALWVLGNMAGEGISARDSVLGHGVLSPLVGCLERNTCSLSMLRIGSWTLSNLCDAQPRPVLDIHLILPVLAKLLQNVDAEVLSHTCWTLSHICDGPSTHIKAVVDTDVCWRLVQLLMHRSWRVTKPALRAIGNIVCAEDETDYTQQILECGAVPCLRHLISHNNREIQKEACWTLSNISAGTIEQIQNVLDSGSIPSLVKLSAASDTDPEVKNEACWVVLNATSCGSDYQIEYMVKHGCVAVLCGLLCEPSMVMMALEGLERILQVGEDEAKRIGCSNPYAKLLSTNKLEELEHHKSNAIAKRATRIWKQHFVLCAICNASYPKHSDEASFCVECKCHVCDKCNCSIFHLDYQQELWDLTLDKDKRSGGKKNNKKVRSNSSNTNTNNNNNNNNNGSDDLISPVRSENTAGRRLSFAAGENKLANFLAGSPNDRAASSPRPITPEKQKPSIPQRKSSMTLADFIKVMPAEKARAK